MSLLIVSNRLPVTIEEDNNSFVLKESSGGLVSGISSYLSSMQRAKNNKASYKWLGWPGKTISESLKKSFLEKSDKMNLKPIFLSEKVMDKFYLGFCNKTIWPLFHYFTTYSVYDEESWNIYKQVNLNFRDELLKVIQADDTIWIHDYHLMLLPKLLRDSVPDAKIGFFLHIPFPSYEIFRMLPKDWRRDILEGMLGADLVGFHTYDYTRYFFSCVQRILGYENNFGQILLPDRLVNAETFPMGIDFDGFANSAESAEAKLEIKQIRDNFGDSKIILSIDRLDYSKGILNRLKGFKRFLKLNPEWHNKVNLLMIVVPSRVGVERYSQMKREINELVGYINGKYGNLNWTPIIYQYRFINQNALSGLYNASDAALITPLRDGMNLISKEYLACKTASTGVLILSEMAGASKELGEALIINPNNTEEIASAIKEALEMPQAEQKRRNIIMRSRIKRYNVNKWADYFINTLNKVKQTQMLWSSRLLDLKHKEEMICAFRRSKKSILFLDYDGTLVPFESRPEQAAPSEKLLKLIESLCSSRGTDIALISGRDRYTMEKWFGAQNIILAAEHGAWIKEKHGEWTQQNLFKTEWKKSIYPFLENYTDLLPGSFIEEKDFSLVWHYRKSDPEQSQVKSREMLDDLVSLTANIDVQVMQGNKIIEIRNNGINKGAIASSILMGDKYDFIFAAGDDWTDEDMFKALPESAYTIKIGINSSHAKYNLHNSGELRNLIEGFINV